MVRGWRLKGRKRQGRERLGKGEQVTEVEGRGGTFASVCLAPV